MKGARCYITDRAAAGGTEQLLGLIRKNVRAGVDYLQIREKDLSVQELTSLVRESVAVAKGCKTSILVNDRMDVAIACGASGVHLRGNSVLASTVRDIAPAHFVISISCHTLAELEEAHGADFALFGPVFPTLKGPGVGIKALAVACKASPVPVFALGGVTFDSEQECLEAGAAGVAGIRLFQ